MSGFMKTVLMKTSPPWSRWGFFIFFLARDQSKRCENSVECHCVCFFFHLSYIPFLYSSPFFSSPGVIFMPFGVVKSKCVTHLAQICNVLFINTVFINPVINTIHKIPNMKAACPQLFIFLFLSDRWASEAGAR